LAFLCQSLLFVAKRFHYPVVGDLTLTFEALDITADGLRITAYTAEPGSPSRTR
jgi:MmyB-like transcription regulator ligand binding domain